MPMCDVTKENFDKEVLESADTVVLDFFAPGCVPCGMLAPIVEGIARDHFGVKVGRVDVNAQPELTEQFGVVEVPTLVVIRSGAVLGTTAGVPPREEILRMLL